MHAHINVMNSLLREGEIVMQQYVWCPRGSLDPYAKHFKVLGECVVSNSLMWLILPQYMLIQPNESPLWSSSGIRAMI